MPDKKTDELDSAVNGIESKFAAGGSVCLHADVTIAVRGDGAPSVSLPCTRGEQAARLAPLLAAMEEAPFGHGHETKYDDSIRKALQLKPERFALDGFGDEQLARILREVRAHLVPDTQHVRAVLHKLNVYAKGGFFADHKDTPRSETHFGSLVVLLPCAFLGGALSVDHNGQQRAFDWGASTDFTPRWMPWSSDHPYERERIEKHTPGRRVQWAAFFGDAVHRVARVEDGFRVALAYELHRAAPPDPTADVLLLRAEGVRAALCRLLRDETFLPKGGHIGFNCRHLYEEKAADGAERELSSVHAACAGAGGAASAPTVKALRALKNEDAVFAVAAASTGLEVRALRVLSGSECDDWVLRKFPTKSEFPSRCEFEDLEEMSHGCIGDGAFKNVEWVGEGGPRRKLKQVQFSGTGYFGNEAESLTFYTRTALLVKVPATGAGARAALRDVALAPEQVHLTQPKPKAQGACASAKRPASPAAKPPKPAPAAKAPKPSPKPAAGGKQPAAAAAGKQPMPAGARRRSKVLKGEFNVETILDMRSTAGGPEYLIKWEGYDKPEDNTWEPEAHVTGCTELLRNFHAERLRLASLGDEAAGAPAAAAPSGAAGAAAAAGADGAGASTGDVVIEELSYGSDEDEDVEDDEDDEDDAENEEPAEARAADAAAGSAPPALYGETKASKDAAAAARLGTSRTVHVSGGKSNRVSDGTCDVTLAPGEGLQQLKTKIRRAFGKVRAPGARGVSSARGATRVCQGGCILPCRAGRARACAGRHSGRTP